MSATEAESQEPGNILLRAWQGKERLAIVWWGFGVPLKIITWLATSDWAASNVYQGNETLLIFSSLLSLAAYVVFTVMAWRCAPNTKEKEWKWIARTALVANWAWLCYQVAVGSA